MSKPDVALRSSLAQLRSLDNQIEHLWQSVEEMLPGTKAKIEKLIAQKDVLLEHIKAVARLLPTPFTDSGYKVSSSSGGTSYELNLTKLKELGYADITIGGRPLLKTYVELDKDVWDEAVKQKLVDPSVAKTAGALQEVEKTRKASIKPEKKG